VLNEISYNPDAEDIRWYQLQKKVHEDRIKRVFNLFRSENIEPVLIKGWAALLNYPPDIPRHFSDTDIAVAASDYERAREICYFDEARPLHIDLHRELRHLDTLSWQDLFDNSRLITLDDVEIRVLRPEDHLRVLCVHWLTDGGAYKHRLWDIFWAVANRPPDFDWERCVGTVAEHRRRWITSTIGIAHQYLGLSVDDLPFAAEAKEIPRWMKKCIEAEWMSDVRLEPVITHIKSPTSLLKQIWKRIPPNPIRATIEMEGDIDAATRIPYQLKCLAKMLSHPLGSHRKTLPPSIGERNA
jgi:Uncharacterised nucleotidyltransferase